MPTLTDALAKSIYDLCLDGLQTDGEHHKQFYLEEILTLLGYDVAKLNEDEAWEPGIAP